jgi:murein DD-endopeptidase MepM/ murein hydrolase activator NlpD
MIVAIFLAAMLILPLILVVILDMAAPTAQGVTQRDIDNLKQNLNALKADKTRVRGEISAVRTRQTDIHRRKALYDEQIAILESEIDLATELISGINLAIAREWTELEAAMAKEAGLMERYITRVRHMEGMGDISYLSILLQANSLSDLLTRYSTVRDIMESDNKLVGELVAVRKDIEGRIGQLTSDRREQYDLRQEQMESQEELEELTQEIYAMMSEYMADMVRLAADERRIAEAEAEAEKELKEAEAELARILEELRRRNNPFVGGEYGWPLPGYFSVGSGFGMRLHPVFRVNRMHSGIDVAAPRGTPIVAANAGEVITRTYSSGYGNYIVIDHGGGQASLYAHMSSFAGNSVGSRVAKGEVIGYVGSTGVSTGNHLHFEIIINGSRVDPQPLLRGR